MTKLLVYIFSFASLLIISCEKLDVQASADLTGEWRYVGTFDHRAYYSCYICPGFDFEKSIYRINFKVDNSFTTQINYMRGEGKYELNLRDKAGNMPIYNLSINDYKELNKPVETNADGVFRSAFLKSYWLTIGEQEMGYDQLKLQFNENEFLHFVKKN